MKAKLTYKEISDIGSKEKYIRKGHYNTIKSWWARRPITSMRSILIKELLIRNNDKSNLVESDLFTKLNPSKNTFKDFSNFYHTKNISVLDVFAGGGSIPFESARLGFHTFSAELNPVASILQETIFNSIQIKDFDKKLRESGYNVIDRVEKRISKFYIINEIKPYVIFWSKVGKCKKCNDDLDLRRLEYLSKRKTKPVKIIEDNSGNPQLSYSLGNEESLKKEFVCRKCKEKNTFKDIKDYCKTNKFKYTPFAICYTDKSKKYELLSKNEKQVLLDYENEIETELSGLSHYLTSELVKSKGGVINPTLYDLKQPKDFFTNRQLLILLTLIDEIIQEYTILLMKFNKAESDQIILSLTSLIEFLVDWNSVSTMWISQNEQSGRSLAGPGVGMKWDFIEINPFCSYGSNLKSKIDRVCDTFKEIRFDNKINIIKGSSTNLPLENNSIDIVLTDPPYYDSIDYTGLSDFFRPWFEIVIKNTFDNNINLKNKEEFEAIVELSKNGKKNHNHYKNIMTQILTEVNRVLKPDGSLLLLYSHKTFEGWKVISEAISSSGLFVSDCYPVDMERKARPRAMAFEALSGVILFRLTKNNNNTSIEEDILALKEKTNSGEISESQIVIYLASLACKQVSLTNWTYERSYEEVIKLYELIKLKKWINGNMDTITKLYLEAKLKGNLIDIEKESLSKLEKAGLINNSTIMSIENIEINDKISNTILEKSVLLYKDFKFNSKTKIELDKESKENVVSFFSILRGLKLNTTAKRSSDQESKVSRLILSKINNL